MLLLPALDLSPDCWPQVPLWSGPIQLSVQSLSYLSLICVEIVFFAHSF
jgi:hypothetical protein